MSFRTDCEKVDMDSIWGYFDVKCHEKRLLRGSEVRCVEWGNEVEEVEIEVEACDDDDDDE
jgi:hypothetical protein